MKFYNVLLFLGFLTAAAPAAEAPDPSLKLREQLRGVMLQLRTAQTDAANAQAAQLAADKKSADFTTGSRISKSVTPPSPSKAAPIRRRPTSPSRN